MSTPIIFIPGIQGTKLMDTNTMDFDVIWSSLKKYYKNLNDLLLEQDQNYDTQTLSIIERSDIKDLLYGIP
jgi:hypothetical protein